ncbi:MAG: sodium:solute symporter [Bryobacteraceae bacterium]|nr:sodium:solute symporter [Bryobacteraceae bacterium]MDW8380134.1 sodium:solute symporter [Bryobacterales bacterium]
MLDTGILLAYFLLVFYIGFRHSRHERTASDYFLAGQHVGWFAVGASLFATNISSEHFIGLAGSGASTGLAVGCYEWSASFCLLLLGWLFVPHYLQSKVYTMPEFLERRFSPACRWYLTVVSLFAYVFTKISVALFAGGILIREIVGWDYMTSAILLVIATGIYTIAGGLAAVIYTDLFQAFILVGGAIVLTLIGLDRAGGFTGLRAALPADFFHMIKPASDPVYPWPGTTIGTLILGIWYWCTDQVIVQKTLSAKSVSQARRGAFFCAGLKVLPVFVLVLPGLIAKALWPSEVTGDNAYPLLVLRLMPPGLMGLMVAALLAALMSSLSSVFNSCSTLITMDIYKKLHPQATERRLVVVGRFTTALIVALSIVWIPFIRNLNNEVYQYLQSVQAYVGAPITAVFLTGILWKGATSQAAIITLVVGGVVGATRFLLDILRNAMKMDLGPWNDIVAFSFLNFSVLVFFFCLLLMIGLSKLGQAPDLARIRQLTLNWSAGNQQRRPLDVVLTGAIGLIILSLWSHFR